MGEMKCSDCKYFSEDLCYRYPPVKGRFALAEYPRVSKWCGEWSSAIELEELIEDITPDNVHGEQWPDLVEDIIYNEVEKSWVDAFKEWIGFD